MSGDTNRPVAAPTRGVPPAGGRSRRLSGPLSAAALVFVLAAALSAALIWRMELQRVQVERARVADLAGDHARSLQIGLERALTSAYALAALVRLGGGAVPNFEALAGEMLPYYPGVSALELAPGGVITSVVPLAGNEKAVGFDLLKDPAQRKEASIARDTGKLTLAGPINLVQGGLGLDGRLPVYLPDAGGRPSFWGFTLVVIRFPGALVPARFPQIVERDFHYELWRTHPATGQKQVIDSFAPNPLVEPVEYSLGLPNGAWTLAISPARGWGDPGGFTFKTALGLLFSLILAAVAKLMVELKAHQQGLEDLVARRTAEIRASERRFSELLGNMHLFAAILDRDGEVAFCNNHLLSQTGWSREEVVGNSWFERFVPPADRTPARDRFARAIGDAATQPYHESALITRGGTERSVVWDTTLLRGTGDEVTGAALIGLDVTEHRNLEAQLLQSRKMEAIGRLAGGIAHDFNNLLTPILGYSELLRSDLAAAGVDLKQVDLITAAALKTRDLTRQLLSFGRKQPLAMQTLDLDELVSSFAGILRRTIRESVEINYERAGSPVLVRADRTRLEQVLMNLVVNAQDAIADRGVITIAVSAAVFDEAFVREHPEARPGSHVLLSVGDSGGGIDEQTLPRIFEPFFSTKEAGRGSGLGLATVYGIVRQHEGCVWVRTGLGQGSVFTVALPSAPVTPATPDTPDTPGKPGGPGTTDAPDNPGAGTSTPGAPFERDGSAGTILLVEDEAVVLSLVRSLLTDCGYRVLAAPDPLRALELARGAKLDLLVSDVVMPGMSGPELHRRLIPAQPGLPVLFMSGYTDTVVAQHIELRDGVNFIQKPFRVADMARLAAALIRGGSTPGP